jgi:hypothetical protein
VSRADTRLGQDPGGDRRAFFRSLGRNGLLGVLGVFGLGWYGRRQVAQGRQVCINRSVCCHCHVFGACELPAARSAKQAERTLGSTSEEQAPARPRVPGLSGPGVRAEAEDRTREKA